MTHLYLPGQPVRAEADAQVAANLIRKGWTELPEKPDPTAEWDGTEWVVPPPPRPQPQWVAFGSFLVSDTLMNQFVVAVAQTAPILDRMITVGLGQAAQGDPQTFGAAWAAARTVGLVSPELIAHMQEAAANFDLPAEFIAGLAAPLTPPAQPE